jgi:biotin carboxyl carrier protein
MRYTYQHDGQTYTLDLVAQSDGNFTVSIGDRTIPVQAQLLASGAYRLVLNGQAHIVHAAAQRDQRYLQVDGSEYTLTVPTAKSTRRKTHTGGDELTAQMPGQVTSVLVKVGEQVARGQTLMIVEAMKMEIRITAPADGLVLEVLVQQGVVVERGQRLVIFETAD